MILDHVDGLDIPDELVPRYGNEFLSLKHLSQGLDLLCHAVKKLEDRARKQVDDGTVFESMPPEVQKEFLGKTVKYFSVGNDPAFEWLHKGLLYCYFQWYAVSACNYVRLVGWLLRQSAPGRPDPWKYVYKVIPDVLWFRDKIAAHFSRAGTKDRGADKIGSVMYQVGFVDGRFRAPIWKVTRKTKGGISKSSEGKAWSLTETHELMRNRYSPRKSEDDVSS